MFKVIWALKRKPGLTQEAFRDHFENNHARLAQKYFGHCMLAYRRNYVNSVGGPGKGGPEANPCHFDCFSEWLMESKADHEKILEILSDPEISKVIAEDSRKFIDGAATMVFTCTVDDTGTGDTHPPA